jgi:hypothetical protein
MDDDRSKHLPLTVAEVEEAAALATTITDLATQMYEAIKGASGPDHAAAEVARRRIEGLRRMLASFSTVNGKLHNDLIEEHRERSILWVIREAGYLTYAALMLVPAAKSWPPDEPLDRYRQEVLESARDYLAAGGHMGLFDPHAMSPEALRNKKEPGQRRKKRWLGRGMAVETATAEGVRFVTRKEMTDAAERGLAIALESIEHSEPSFFLRFTTPTLHSILVEATLAYLGHSDRNRTAEDSALWVEIAFEAMIELGLGGRNGSVDHWAKKRGAFFGHLLK